MLTMALLVGHPTMKLDDIDPSKSQAYSPNLYAWMKKRAHFFRDGGHAEHIYRVRANSSFADCFGAGTLMVGRPADQYAGDSDFSGVRLYSALCSGAKAGRMCYVGVMDSLERVEGFWDHYLKVGRCAIDPEHQEHFLSGDRYLGNGSSRICLWCGAQRLAGGAAMAG